MTVLQIADITSYLVQTGWSRLAETPRGAVIWGDAEDRQVLVPPRDGMGDGELRVREIVKMLSEAEGRPEYDIVADIDAPGTDVQRYRVFPAGVPSGFVPLAFGADIVRTLSVLFAESARAVLESERDEDRQAAVDGLLRRIRLGVPAAGSYVVTVHLPADDPLARRTGLRLADGVAAARRELDGLPTATGLSADLCTALSELAGPEGDSPFEVGFGWARGVPAAVSASTVSFPGGAGERLRRAAARIRQRAEPGDAVLTGHIVDLHDDGGEDRWRVRVRGAFTDASGAGARRVLWVRLADERTYRRALDAHSAKRTVRARGSLARAGRRTELVTSPEGFEVLGGAGKGTR